ncbi:unnamed protein product [Spirodela intermedia]|uniref:Uncharacterized protein n=1 Tax=Spirodela intermedia TaxID=51605 RepID=A0A7I8KIK9_SPIIN|nr:unnamed protein product [Spirodela intermedia]
METQEDAPLPIEGVVDHLGQPIFSRGAAGGWPSAAFIIGAELSENFAHTGISMNLISYLTGPFQESTASAAANMNTLTGVSLMLPLLGGFIGDYFLGRYRTTVVSSLLYVLGLAMLVASAVAPSLRPPECGSDSGSRESCLPSQFQIAFFFSALYLVAVAQGGHKACTQAFGVDQFDGDDPKECRSRGSFFNWLHFGVSSGMAFTVLLMSYVQDNIGWGLGFGLPCASMAISLVLFLAGTRTYRYCAPSGKNPLAQLAGADCNFSSSQRGLPHEEAKEALLRGGSAGEEEGVAEGPRAVLRLLPIGVTCLLYAVVLAQSTTFFTKQGSTMDRRITPSFLVPPAALQSFIHLSVLAFVPIYDRLFVPITRAFTGRPSGLTMLQRIGVGMVLSIFAVAIAAKVETKRLQTARDLGLVDLPGVAIPMSLWWLVPQYVLFGVSSVFTVVGLQEFFYDQVPVSMRSLGFALYLSIFGVGSFISGFFILVIENVSTWWGEDWFSDNLNRAHLDYFYWFLAALSSVELLLYLYLARSFVYKQRKKGSGAA